MGLWGSFLFKPLQQGSQQWGGGAKFYEGTEQKRLTKGRLIHTKHPKINHCTFSLIGFPKNHRWKSQRY